MTSTEIIPYRPLYRSLLVQSLEDEGLTIDQMTFEQDHTVIFADRDGPVGFFSFEIAHGRPALNHVLVFKERRHEKHLIFMSKIFIETVAKMGFDEFTFRVPPDKEYTKAYVIYWTGKDEPYVANENGWHYLIPIVRSTKEAQNEDIH